MVTAPSKQARSSTPGQRPHIRSSGRTRQIRASLAALSAAYPRSAARHRQVSENDPMEYPLRLVVDGETFVVTEDLTQPGSYDYQWLSGPNPGYGFGESLAVLHEPDGPSGQPWISHDHRATLEEHEEAARNFLEQVDPATGFIADE